jgi:hypothetical protein
LAIHNERFMPRLPTIDGQCRANLSAQAGR